MLLGINLVEACKDYEEKHGGRKEASGPTAWHQYELRAFRVREGGPVVGKTAEQAEAMLPEHRVFVQRIRRGGEIIDGAPDTVIQAGDIVAIAGRRDVLVNVIGPKAEEVEDRELLSVPAEGVDILVTNKEADGKTLAELARMPSSRGIYLRKITRGATAIDIPILADTKIYRGDIVTLVGGTKNIAAASKALGVVDRVTDVADVAFIGIAITIGATGRRLCLEGRRRSAHAVNVRRRADRGPVLRMVALGEAEVRADSDPDTLVHEFGRLERLHRHRRHFVGTELRRRPAEAWLQPVRCGASSQQPCR